MAKFRYDRALIRKLYKLPISEWQANQGLSSNGILGRLGNTFTTTLGPCTVHVGGVYQEKTDRIPFMVALRVFKDKYLVNGAYSYSDMDREMLIPFYLFLHIKYGEFRSNLYYESKNGRLKITKEGKSYFKNGKKEIRAAENELEKILGLHN